MSSRRSALAFALLLAACAGQQGGPVKTAAASAVPARTWDDPFAYCAAVKNVDEPDARYSGPRVPEEIARTVQASFSFAGDMPLEQVGQGVVWRCMKKRVVACFAGANLPCFVKPSAAEARPADLDERGFSRELWIEIRPRR